MRFRLRNSKQASGFSLVETMVVVAILLCVSAYAIPNFMVGIANLRLRSGTSSLSGLLHNCRMQAIKRNRNMSAHFTTMSGGAVAFIKAANEGSTLDSDDPLVQLGSTVTMNQTPSGTGAPTELDNSTLGYTPSKLDPSFNPRGLPCLYSSGTCTTGTGFVYYFTVSPAIGGNIWGAVTVSPAGHVKTWMWNGSAWKN